MRLCNSQRVYDLAAGYGMSFAQSSRSRRWAAFPRGPLVPRNGPSCGEHGSRATDLSTKNHAGTFEAWFRHLAKSLVQRADNAAIHNCRDTRVNISKWSFLLKSSTALRKDSGDTATYTIMRSYMCRMTVSSEMLHQSSLTIPCPPRNPNLYPGIRDPE
jgi:hypothetical protein